MVEALLGLGLVFFARVADVTVGCIRMLYTMRGQRLISGLLALIEASVFIFAITQVMQNLTIAKMIGYALGYSVGTMLGVTIEAWIASGHVVVRVISGETSRVIRDRIAAEGFGFTVLPAEGRDGPRTVLFVVARRKRAPLLLKLLAEADPKAFVTLDPVHRIIGGYMPLLAPAPVASVRK